MQRSIGETEMIFNQLAESRVEGAITRVRFHPSKPLLYTRSFHADEDIIQIWTMDNRSELQVVREFRTKHTPRRTYRGDWKQHTQGRTLDAAFHPEESWIAITQFACPLTIYHYEDGSVVRSIAKPSSASAVVFSGTGRYLIYSTCSNCPDIIGDYSLGKSAVYDLKKDRSVGVFWHSNFFAVHPSLPLFAAGRDDQGGATIRFFSHRQELRSFKYQIELVPGLSGLVFSPDGQSLMTIGSSDLYSLRRYHLDPLTRVWAHDRSFSCNEVLPHEEEGCLTERVLFSGDSSFVISADVNSDQLTGDIVVFRASDGAFVVRQPAHSLPIRSMDANYRLGLMATVAPDGFLKIWESPDLILKSEGASNLDFIPSWKRLSANPYGVDGYTIITDE
jgi:WD40 repeat protein